MAAEAGAELTWETRSFFQVPQEGAGFHFRPSSVAFPGCSQRAAWEPQQLGHEPGSTWDPGA